jgi:hypothetical protein
MNTRYNKRLTTVVENRHLKQLEDRELELRNEAFEKYVHGFIDINQSLLLIQKADRISEKRRQFIESLAVKYPIC